MLPLGLAMAVLAAALVVLVLFVRRIGDFGVETDFYGSYAGLARGLLAGRFHPADYGVVGPVFIALLAVALAAGAPAFAAGQWISLGATLGSAILWTDVTRRVVGRRTARWVAGCLLLSPAFVHFGAVASTDALNACLMALAVWALVRARSARGSVAAGLAGAAAFLTRYVSAVLVPFAVVWTGGRPAGRRRLLAWLAAFAAVPALAAGLVLTAGGRLPEPRFLLNMRYELERRGTDWDAYGAARGNSGVGSLKTDLPAIALRAARNVPGHLRAEAEGGAGWVLAALAVAGAVLLLRERNGPAVRLLGLGAIQFAALLPVQASERYALVQVPLYALAGAVAVEAWLARARAAAPALRRAAMVALALAAGAALALNARHQAADRAKQPLDLLEMAGRLRDQVPEGAMIVARKPHLPFLLDARWRYFPDVEGLAALRADLREGEADYLFYGRSEISLRPRFRYLLAPQYRPEGLQVVESDGAAGTLYRITPGFFTAPTAPDDDRLRGLENAVLAADDPVGPALDLARYQADTGRWGDAVLTFRAAARLGPLPAADRLRLEEAGRRAAGERE